MSDTESKIEPQTIIVARFDSADEGHGALKQLKHVHRKEHVEIVDAALLRKNEKGRLRIAETSDWSGRKGMAVGGVAGAAIGVITGGIGFLAVGGAAVAGLAARLRDTGFDNARLRELTEQLDPDSSALLVVCPTNSAARCAEVCHEAGAADVYRVELDLEITAELHVEGMEFSKDEETTVV